MTSSTVPSVTAAGTSPAGLIAEFERRLAGTEPLNWYGERFKALSRDERLSLYKRCSVNEFATLYLSAGNYKAEAELATRPCECFHRCGDVCKCFNTLRLLVSRRSTLQLRSRSKSQSRKRSLTQPRKWSSRLLIGSNKY